jgi:hypothetical protein
MSRSEPKPNLNGGNFIFRFRGPKALLESNPAEGGFEELERQTIYFAKPDTLNDPMEGLTDAFWQGDTVLWENLLRHYVLSLSWYLGAWLITDSDAIAERPPSAWLTESDLPTDALREIYRDLVSDFCAEIEAQELAATLGRQAIALRRERFTNLLFLVHQTAVHHVFRAFKKRGMLPFDVPRPKTTAGDAKTVAKAWDDLVLDPPTLEMPIEHQLELLARTTNQVNHQLELGMLSRADRKDDASKWIALLTRFPQLYVEAFLRDLHFMPWRVACFSRQCANASMWGSYGVEHRGAALVFRTTERAGKRSFNVQGLLGSGAQGSDLEVHPISYRRSPPPLDSFLEIGMLPLAKLEKTWMKSQAGAASARLVEITRDVAAWRKAHWAKSIERSTWKHSDWAHETEVRLIASTVFNDDPAPKALTYDFSQLEGIVFGMRMATADKLRIASIIEKKCRAEKRQDFRFFQAYYSPEKGEMDVIELSLLTFTA